MVQLTTDIKKYIDKSVLCWLATADENGMPNVSPKEIFTFYGDKIIVANIASPNTVRNIGMNENVCVSFVDILVQKGYQIKGAAKIIDKSNQEFPEIKKPLLEMAGDLFPFSSITVITVKGAKPILAPSYLMYPDTTEADQIENAKRAYNLNY